MSQLTPYKNFDASTIVFSKAKEEKIPGSILKYKRINMSVKTPDGTITDLIVPTPTSLFSFGVSENKSAETGALSGYSLSLCLHNKDGVTEDELSFCKMIDDIIEVSRKHLIEVKSTIGAHDLEDIFMKKFFPTPIYRKKNEDGSIDTTKSPVLYPKLTTRKDKKTGSLTITTTLYEAGKYDASGEPLELSIRDVLGAYCTVTAALKIESIYIGKDKYRIQIKVVEADIMKIGGGKTNLLRTKRIGGKVSSDKEKAEATALVMSDHEGEP